MLVLKPINRTPKNRLTGQAHHGSGGHDAPENVDQVVGAAAVARHQAGGGAVRPGGQDCNQNCEPTHTKFSWIKHWLGVLDIIKKRLTMLRQPCGSVNDVTSLSHNGITETEPTNPIDNFFPYEKKL